MTCHVALRRGSREAGGRAMNDSEDRCIVCGDVSAELICRACHRVIGARPMRPDAESGATPSEEVLAGAQGSARGSGE
jgi:hypothetical protein